MIAIFRGDDTAFAGANSVRVTIGTSVSLSGCRAEFNLCGVVKQIPDASTGTFTVAFTAEETAAMPLGVQCATVRVFDSQGRVRTASNTVRVLVTDRVDEAYRYTNATEVTLASPGGIIDDGRGVPDDLPEEYTPDEMRTFLNRLAALIRNSMAALVALLMLPVAAQDWTNRVSTARFGAIRATSNVVTSVDLSGFITNAPAPGNYETVSTLALSAVQPSLLSSACTAATNYTDLATQSLVHVEQDPTVPEWAKSPTPPASGLSTNDVCNIVTNEVVEFTAWEKNDGGDGWDDDKTRNIGMPIWDDVYGEWRVFYEYWDYDPDTGDGHWASDMAVLSGDINATILYFSQYWWFTRDRITRNALGLARLVDLPPLTNGLASATSVSAANTRASNAQNMAVAASNTAESVAGTVAAWETYWDGDEVRVTVTNYDSAVHLPSLYIEQKLENTNAYRTVWDERTRWASNDVQMAEMRSAIDEKADRAWGFYDSHTGNYAPDGYTWLSSPRIAIAGGLAYQRTLTTYGAVWVLASNGLVAETNGDADTGYFRIKDDEGNTTFEIVRGNKRTVGATAAGIKVTSPRNSPTTTIEIPYNVTSDVPPTLYGTVSLSSPEWAEISATWTGQSGAWTGTVASSTSTYFIKGTYEVGGETYIKNVAPISVESGIYCTDGIHKVRPVYTNGTITWEVVQ